MSADRSYRGVQYLEHDFRGLVEDAGQRVQLITDTIYDEQDARVDDALRAQDLKYVADELNWGLWEQGYIGCSALIGPGAIAPVEQYPFQELQVTDKTIAGIYEGVKLRQEKLVTPDGNPTVALGRTALYHRFMLLNRSINTDDVESTVRLFAHAPLESDDFEVLRPAVTTLQNQRWLKGIASPLFDEKNAFGLAQLEAVFQRLIHADHSIVPLTKNLDWFYDHIGEITCLPGKYVSLHTDEVLFQSSGYSQYVGWGRSEVEGTVLGFCAMPTYEVDPEHKGKQPRADLDKPRLAVCIEVSGNNGVLVAKVPVAALQTKS